MAYNICIYDRIFGFVTFKEKRRYINVLIHLKFQYNNTSLSTYNQINIILQTVNVNSFKNRQFAYVFINIKLLSIYNH